MIGWFISTRSIRPGHHQTGLYEKTRNEVGCLINNTVAAKFFLSFADKKKENNPHKNNSKEYNVQSYITGINDIAYVNSQRSVNIRLPADRRPLQDFSFL